MLYRTEVLSINICYLPLLNIKCLIHGSPDDPLEVETRGGKASTVLLLFLENVKILKYVEASLDHLRYFGQI